MQHNVVYFLSHLRGRTLFLWLGCLHADLSACLFSWILFKATYPKQTCVSSTSHSIFQETELLPSSAELAMALYCLPWYSDASVEAQRNYIFTVYRAKNLVVRITAGCGMEGERTLFLFLFLLLPCCQSWNTVLSVVLAVLGVHCSRSTAEGSLKVSLWPADHCDDGMMVVMKVATGF